MTVKRSEYSLRSEAYLEDVGEEITVGYKPSGILDVEEDAEAEKYFKIFSQERSGKWKKYSVLAC